MTALTEREMTFTLKAISTRMISLRNRIPNVRGRASDELEEELGELIEARNKLEASEYGET